MSLFQYNLGFLPMIIKIVALMFKLQIFQYKCYNNNIPTFHCHKVNLSFWDIADRPGQRFIIHILT